MHGVAVTAAMELHGVAVTAAMELHGVAVPIWVQPLTSVRCTVVAI